MDENDENLFGNMRPIINCKYHCDDDDVNDDHDAQRNFNDDSVTRNAQDMKWLLRICLMDNG